MNRILLFSCCLLLTLGVLCQCTSEIPPGIGTIRQIDPKAQAFWAEAQSFEKKGKDKKAIGIYEDIIEYCPLSREAPNARYRMGELWKNRKDYQEAFDDYQKFVEQYPDNHLYKTALAKMQNIAFRAAKGELTHNLLWMFKVKMDPTLITKWLTAIADLAPQSKAAPEALSILGQYQRERKNWVESIAANQKLIDQYPDDALAPAAQLAIADSYANVTAEGNRNQANALNAQEAYEDFLQRYANHPLASNARTGLAKTRSELVQQKLDRGIYYMTKAKDNQAALFSFQETVAQKAHNPQAAITAEQYIKKLSGSTPKKL